MLAALGLLLGSSATIAPRAATPPATVNYQGVLRDQNDVPLSGTYDMVLRFMDAPTAGNEILVDQHTAAGSNAVTVTNGLFNVALGSGTLSDGSGPGTYASLDAVFGDYGNVWLEVQVGAETLSPRTPIQSAPYALNSADLAGHPDSFFLDTSATTQAKNGELDVSSAGTAIYAQSTGSSGYGLIASSSHGYAIWALGTAGVRGEASVDTGGFFSGATAGVEGTGPIGVIGQGNGVAGGRFFNCCGSVTTEIATTTKGINVTGGDYGGYFQSSSANSTGVYASAVSRGGYFADAAGDYATLASGQLGIMAVSVGAAGNYFSNGAPYYSYTNVPYYDLGIDALGPTSGGRFRNFGTSAYAYLGYSSYKIQGSGSVSFVQNHPSDPSKVIVYAAPEGDEVAVYTRGSARLVNGEARVPLGETFALVANPDIGLTATATPRGEPVPLSVSELSTNEVLVRGPAGSNAEFDYMVWGLRIGFEEQSIVQPKKDESKIPSMHQHEKFFEDDPGLRKYTALQRFTAADEAVHGKRKMSLARADSLREAVGVFPYRDPAGLEHDPGRLAVGLHEDPAPAGGAPHASLSAASAAPVSDARAPRATELPADSARAAGASFDLFVTEDPIEAGDVVSLSQAAAGSVARSAGPNDALIIGCAQAGPSLTGGQVAVATAHVALCRADASFGAIAIGDRLTAAPARGAAMRADAGSAGAADLGRAIDPLPSGTGLIRVLLGGR